ncbi:Stage II sporulation protein R [compost metagenome]
MKRYGTIKSSNQLRSYHRLGRQIALIMFSMFILLMSWEGQRVDSAAVAVEGQNVIPQDSIRLRILANSDRVSDQAVKRRVRDAVVEQMNSWVGQLDNPQSLDDARHVISENLDAVEKIVEQTLKSSGKNYGYTVELGVVPFPTKMYGGAIYPAGNYEALRITLGEGEGKNWWCVLFPPLCFVDAGSGDALAQNQKAEASKAKAGEGSVDNESSAKLTASTAGAEGDATQVQADPEETEVRFFLWDMLVGFWNWVTGLFS